MKVMSIFLLVEKTLDVNKKSDRYNSTAEVLSSYILLAILFVISLLLSCGILMKRGPLVIPFLALQFLDLISSSLMFCSVYIEQPSFQASEGVKMKDKMSERLLQAPAQMAFDICLNLLIQCSSFSVFPSYLKLEYINPMNDFPKKNMSSKKYVLDLVLFNIMYISVLILKAIFISHIWRVFVSLHHKKSSKDEDAQKQQEISKHIILKRLNTSADTYVRACFVFPASVCWVHLCSRTQKATAKMEFCPLMRKQSDHKPLNAPFLSLPQSQRSSPCQILAPPFARMEEDRQ